MMDDYEEYEEYDEYEDFDMDDSEAEAGTQSGEADSRRTFIIVAAILGAILVLSMICMVVYALVIMPGRQEAREQEAAAINAQNTAVALASGLTAEAEAWTDTPTITPTSLPATPTPTRTPVLAPTNTPMGAEPTADPRTATVSALLTAQAEMILTATPAATALPDTGFIDNAGIPALLALAAGLVVVIFLARRLRTAG